MGPMHILLVGTLAVGAQTTSSQIRQPQAADSANVLVNEGKQPYAQIFRQPVPQNPNLNRDMQPRVVCGTVVVPVKPDWDAKMIVAPKETGRPHPEYRIRKIAPTICNE